MSTHRRDKTYIVLDLGIQEVADLLETFPGKQICSHTYDAGVMLATPGGRHTIIGSFFATNQGVTIDLSVPEEYDIEEFSRWLDAAVRRVPGARLMQ